MFIINVSLKSPKMNNRTIFKSSRLRETLVTHLVMHVLVSANIYRIDYALCVLSRRSEYFKLTLDDACSSNAAISHGIIIVDDKKRSRLWRRMRRVCRLFSETITASCTAGCTACRVRVRFKNFLRSGVFRLIITLRIIEQILSVISRVLRPGRFLAERMAGRGNL